MAISMTGFGRGEQIDESYHFIVESKSINHRYLDVNIRMPRKISFLEEKIRNYVKRNIKRGRIDVYVNMEFTGQNNMNINLDMDLAKKYHNALASLRDGLDGVRDDVSVMNIAKFPEVIKTEEAESDEDYIFSVLEKALEKSVQKLDEMRKNEGNQLAEDIKNRCAKLDGFIDSINEKANSVVVEYKEKLNNRISEILDSNIELDQNRLAQEIAYFADRCSITEEIVRFKSHINQLLETIELDDSIGRKIDFLIQEMNREINTIGSKSSNLEITKSVVEVKSELEKIREQIQNIE